MRGLLLLTAALCIVCCAAAPTTQPSTPGALVAELGSNEYRVRAAAQIRLRELGAAALPALREAAGSPDPEIQQRVRALALLLQSAAPTTASADIPGHNVIFNHGRVVVFNGGQLIINNNAGNFVFNNNNAQADGTNTTVNISVTPDGSAIRDIDSTQSGLTVHVRDGALGVWVSITQRDGQFSRYQASNADDLKEKSPEIYGLYQKCVTAAGPNDDVLLPAQN